MNKKEKEKLEAVEFLTVHLGIKPGDTLYTRVESVSRSGMYRNISVYFVKDNQPINISWHIAKVTNDRFNDKLNAVGIGGCGMDMGFHLVYSLSHCLFKGNFQCTGKGCPANDHHNKPYPERDGKMMHVDAGYALIQRWM